MEYVLGPILALLFGMKFTHFTDERLKKKVTDLTARVERVEKLCKRSGLYTVKHMNLLMIMARTLILNIYITLYSIN